MKAVEKREARMFGCSACQICNKLRHFTAHDLKSGYASLARQQLKVCCILTELEQGCFVLLIL